MTHDGADEKVGRGLAGPLLHVNSPVAGVRLWVEDPDGGSAADAIIGTSGLLRAVDSGDANHRSEICKDKFHSSVPEKIYCLCAKRPSFLHQFQRNANTRMTIQEEF